MTSIESTLATRVSAKAAAVRSTAKFARPSDTAAYAAGDVVSDRASIAKVIEFPEVGGSGLIKSAQMLMGETDTASFVLLLFDQEPTNVQDNAAYAPSEADLEKLVGMVTFLNADKTNLGTNLELYRMDEAHLDLAYTSDSGKLYGILVTNSVWTPASATAFTLALSCEVDQ